MRTMMPGSRCSGRRAASPLRAIHVAFSHVTMSSPKAASTMGLPESCTANLQQEVDYIKGYEMFNRLQICFVLSVITCD